MPADLQEGVLKCVKKFFALPQEEKELVLKGECCSYYFGVPFVDGIPEKNSWNRGYEKIGSQILEPGTAPDLKEGFYIGEEIPKDHPYFVQKKLNSGPNFWPETIENVEEFKTTCMSYYKAMHALARDVLVVIAQTLDLDPSYFMDFTTDAVATLRFLHYPPQPADSDEKISRGIGAHTDFGSVTLLVQDEVDGLQVYEKSTDEWLDVRWQAWFLALSTTIPDLFRAGRAHKGRLCRQSRRHVHAMVCFDGLLFLRLLTFGIQVERQIRFQYTPRHQQVGQGEILDPILLQWQSRLRC